MPGDPLEHVSEQALVGLTRSLVRIPSQYIDGELVQHREVAAFLAEHMASFGLEVEIAEPVKDYPVVIGTSSSKMSGEDRPIVGIIGHYSTVAAGNLEEWDYDPFGAEVVGDRIYGRGAADQKSGIAVGNIAAASLIRTKEPLRGRLRLIWVPGEGCTEIAVGPIVRDHPDSVRADYYLMTDGDRARIRNVHAGWTWLEFTARGRGGHTGALTADRSVPINPVEKLLTVMMHLRNPAWMGPVERHPLFGPEYGRYSRDPIVDLTVLSAGDKVNMIPNRARGQLDIRLLPSQSLEDLYGKLDRTLGELRQADPDLDVSYRVIHDNDKIEGVPTDHPAVRAIHQACQEMREPIPGFGPHSGGGRTNFAKLGYVIYYGASNGKGTHAPNEYTVVGELVKSGQIYTRLLTKVLT
ncbi:MAG TPA: M20/M25/M40 family metallo-hydrolase [Anaerolineales bacterium]|nr:M20/M25/M40 family metallo-hydrolase [Anaerolineales bacterium]